MKKIIGILLAAVLIASCRNKEQLGPDLAGIYGPVTVTESFSANNSNPNFSSGDKVIFGAKFEKDASWIITITGNTSGATKTITGIGKTLNAENAVWNGTSDAVPSFGVENVTAVLSFTSTSDTYPLALTIAGTRNPDQGGVIVSNFLVSKRYCCGFPIPNGWPSDYPNITNADNAYVKPDGNNYLLMSGVPWQANSPYVNYMTIAASSADVNHGTYFPLYADPSKVYFNVMVYGTRAETPYAWLQINLIEDGPDGDVGRTMNIRPNWTGWKLISVKYSDLAAGSAVAANTRKVKAVQFVLLSDSPTLPGPSVKVAFDHATFTHNAPYQP